MTTRMKVGNGLPPLESRITVVTMRDSAGDTRTDESGPGPQQRRVEVMDVLHHCRFEWVEPAPTTAGQVARVTCSPLKFKRYNAGSPDGMEQRMLRTKPDAIDGRFDRFEMEPLGEKTILGVRAVGQKQTRFRKQPDGTETLEYASETWWSPELKELLELKPIGDASLVPGFVETELKRGEPDRRNFYPPEGWRIER